MLLSRIIYSNLAVAIPSTAKKPLLLDYLLSPSASLIQPNGTMLKIRLTGFAWVLLFQCLIMAMPVLKLLGLSAVAGWSWVWVLAPVWGPGALLALVLAIEWVVELGRPKSQQ